MSEFKRIVVHHSASEFGCANLINDWHVERGFRMIGYHFVIMNGYPNSEDFKNNRKWSVLDGNVEIGRRLDQDAEFEKDEVGAHVGGMNTGSIGVCLIHNTNQEYSMKQLFKLNSLIYYLKNIYNISIDNVVGHYELDKKKPNCPSIDMVELRNKLILE